jgi:prophage regulatory protein
MAAQQPRGLRLSYARLHSARATVGITPRPGALPLVLYSPQHIARLEKVGQFPKRVQLGPNRVGWVEREVLEWLEVRLAQREVLN